MSDNTLNDLRKERVETLIALGEKASFFVRTGLIENPELCEIAKKISLTDKRIYDLGEQLIPAEGSQICPSCKSAIEQGAKFCNSCGLNFALFYSEKVKNCPVCEAVIETGYVFCPICGCRGGK